MLFAKFIETDTYQCFVDYESRRDHDFLQAIADDICEKIGCDKLEVLFLVPNPPFTAGFNTREGFIGVHSDIRKMLDDSEVRFTIAHEIAHATLHKDRDLKKESSDDHMAKEVEADAFAVKFSSKEVGIGLIRKLTGIYKNSENYGRKRIEALEQL